jgi:hypothetical protein
MAVFAGILLYVLWLSTVWVMTFYRKNKQDGSPWPTSEQLISLMFGRIQTSSAVNIVSAVYILIWSIFVMISFFRGGM